MAPVIRGQSLDAFSGVRPGVLPYFNEVQVNSGGSTGFYDLANVQVLKGPQGTLFGRNATGGAVLFASAKPVNDFEGYAALRGGNYALLQAEGAINVPIIDDRVLLRIAGFVQRRDGFQRNLFDGEWVGNVRRQGVRASLTLKPADGIVNDTVVDYAHSGGSSTSGVINTIYPTRSTNAPAPANFLFTPAIDALFGPGAFKRYLTAHPNVDPDGIVAFTAKQRERGPYVMDVDSPNFYRAHNLVVMNTTTVDLAQDIQLKNISGYTHLVSHVGADLDGSPYTVDQRGGLGANSTIRQLSDEVQIIGKAFDRRLSDVAGFYFSDERNSERDLSVIFDIAPLIQPTNQINSGITKSRSYAGYAQGTLDLSDLIGVRGLGVTLGGRYTARVTASARGDVYAQSSTVYSSTTNTLSPGSYIPGYALANFRVGIADDRAGWSLTANLKNAFNNVYYTGGLALGNLFTLNTVVPGDRRTISVEARIKF